MADLGVNTNLGSFLTPGVSNAYSNPTGSILKVGSETKQAKAAVNAATPEDLTSFYKTFLLAGYGVPSGDPGSFLTPTKIAADFYRNGAQGNGSDTLPRLVEEPGETIASIRVVGKTTPNSNNQDTDLIPPFSKFFLESVQESENERTQIVETFGNFYVFFFGKRPPIYTFSGTLLNTESINWYQDYMLYYDRFLRGTKCVELNAKLLLTYGFTQVEGFILNTSLASTAINDKGVGFSFQVLVIDRTILKLSLDFGLINSNGQFAQDQSFLKLFQQGLSDLNSSRAFNQANNVLNKVTSPAAGNLLKSSDLSSAGKEFADSGIQIVTTSRGTLQLGQA